jgi:hypothetical protein
VSVTHQQGTGASAAERDDDIDPIIAADDDTPFTLEELPPNFWGEEHGTAQNTAPLLESDQQPPPEAAREGNWAVLQELFPGRIIDSETLFEESPEATQKEPEPDAHKTPPKE